MPNPSFRVSQEIYEQMKSTAESENVSLSDFIRTAVIHALDDNGEPADVSDERLAGVLQVQLTEKDEQIRELHQLLAVQSKTTAALTEQLDTSRQMIEDMRRPWWRRMFKRSGEQRYNP